MNRIPEVDGYRSHRPDEQVGEKRVNENISYLRAISYVHDAELELRSGIGVSMLLPALYTVHESDSFIQKWYPLAATEGKAK